MPELAEVEYFRKRWDPGLGAVIHRVHVHPQARVFRRVSIPDLIRALTSARLTVSESAGKQMLFRTDREGWLGIHLGMTGSLEHRPVDAPIGRADHLVLEQRERQLVFIDPRMFGAVKFSSGREAPVWWSSIPPAILSDDFTVGAVTEFLTRRGKAPIKAVLLMQERFPGVGNWMADEILWRAAIHPKAKAGGLSPAEIRTLHRECRWVARHALRIIGNTFEDPPSSWLFPHRWEDGGRCPRTGVLLKREDVGGRTTCWSPARQTLREAK